MADISKIKLSGSTYNIKDAEARANKIDTAGAGLTKSGTSIGHSNSVVAKTTLAFSQIAYDDQGHITGSADATAAQMEAINSGATAEKIAAIETINTKAADLQEQIDNIISPVTQDAEVQNARVAADATSYTTLKERLDADDAAAKSLNARTNAIIDSYVNGVADLTVNVVSNTSTKVQYNLVKGRKYVYSNKTSGAVNLKVYDANDTSTTILSSLDSGKSYFFTCEGNYSALSIWGQQSGECTLSSIDSGIYGEQEHIKDYGALADINELLKQNGDVFDISRVGNGAKFTTNRNVTSGNYGTYINIPVDRLSIRSIEFDIESNGGSPQIFVGKNGGVTHINRIINDANITFTKKHIAFDLPDDNIADGDAASLVIWNATGALANGWFTISNLVWKRDTVYNKVANLNAADVPITNKLLSDMYDAERWNKGTLAKNAENIVYTAVDGQNGGVESKEIASTTRGFLNFEFEIAETYNSDLTVYLFGKSTSGSALFLVIESGVRNAGEYKYNIDLNHYVVYNGLDLTQPVRTALTTDKANNGESLTLNYFNTYDSTTDLEIEGSVSDGINYVNNAVNALNNKVDTMSASTKVTDENGNTYFLKVVSGQLTIVPAIASKILYIGNSLLLGFDTFGMAASDSSNDYYAYVNQYLTSKGATLTADKLRGSDWESKTSYDDQNTWMQSYLLPKLNSGLELVIVQLGDNVNTAEKQAVFAQGAINLLTYIRQHAPLARIAWVGAWYTTPTRQRQMAEACKQCGATFVDISLLPDIEGNRNHIGATYTDDNGVEHEITSSGVASHPSSQGMRAVADAIINALF